MIAFCCFVVASVLAFAAATGANLTSNPAAWAIFFGFLGLAFQTLPYGPRWPDR